jgi:hypothetical protein
MFQYRERMSETVSALTGKVDDLMRLATASGLTDRTARLQELVTKEVAFINPGATAMGIESLADLFDWLSRTFAEDTQIRRTSALDLHHDHFCYSWQRISGGSVEALGIDFGQVASDGRIAKIVTFDRPL